jgi:hypothetical protein
MILNAFTHHFRNIHPHPIHISANFLNKSVTGPCVIEINDIKPGKNHSIAYAILKQASILIIKILKFIKYLYVHIL